MDVVKLSTKRIIIGDSLELEIIRTRKAMLMLTTGEKLQLKQVMVVPNIAKNIINIGCLETVGNEVHMKNGVMTNCKTIISPHLCPAISNLYTYTLHFNMYILAVMHCFESAK